MTNGHPRSDLFVHELGLASGATLVPLHGLTDSGAWPSNAATPAEVATLGNPHIVLRRLGRRSQQGEYGGKFRHVVPQQLVVLGGVVVIHVERRNPIESNGFRDRHCRLVDRV